MMSPTGLALVIFFGKISLKNSSLGIRWQPSHLDGSLQRLIVRSRPLGGVMLLRRGVTPLPNVVFTLRVCGAGYRCQDTPDRVPPLYELTQSVKISRGC